MAVFYNDSDVQVAFNIDNAEERPFQHELEPGDRITRRLNGNHTVDAEWQGDDEMVIVAVDFNLHGAVRFSTDDDGQRQIIAA